MKTSVIVLLILPLAAFAFPKPSQRYDNQLTLRDDVYRVFWSANDDVITFEVQVRTRGWFAFGLTTNSTNSPKSDIVTAWVTTGWRLFIQDRHASGNEFPVVDVKQDWQGVWGAELGGVTVVKFRRKLRTCDPDDLDITTGNIRLVYAWHALDPGHEGLLTSAQDSGSMTVTLIKDASPETIPADSKNLRFFLNNVIVPQSDMSIYYSFFALPKFDREQFIISFEAAIQSGNEAHVQAIIPLWCDADVDPDLVHGLGADLTTIRTHPVLSGVYAKCKRMIWLWLPGEKKWNYPLDVGLPIGRADSSRVIVLEVRYWNVNSQQELFDSSGIIMTISPTPRPTSADVIFAGADSLVVPPHASDFTQYAICNFETCLQWVENTPEIHLFAVNVVAYSTATRVHLRHFRDGQELPLVAEERNVDGQYHRTLFLKNPTTIKLQTDQLVLECHYDTTDKSTMAFHDGTPGGEMCVGFYYFYPSTGFMRCKHDVLLDNLMPLVGVEQMFSNRTVAAPASMAGKSWKTALSEADWTDQQLRAALEQTSNKNTANFSCDKSDSKRVYSELLPYDMQKYQAPSKVCTNSPLQKKREWPPTYDFDC